MFINCILGNWIVFPIAVWAYTSEFPENAGINTLLWRSVVVFICFHILSILAFLSIIEKNYFKTFTSFESGTHFTIRVFHEATDDEVKIQILTKDESQWKTIRHEIKIWIESRWEIWRDEQPLWFDAYVISRIPVEMIPESSSDDVKAVQRIKKASQFHRKSSLMGSSFISSPHKARSSQYLRYGKNSVKITPLKKKMSSNRLLKGQHRSSSKVRRRGRGERRGSEERRAK